MTSHQVLPRRQIEAEYGALKRKLAELETAYEASLAEWGRAMDRRLGSEPGAEEAVKTTGAASSAARERFVDARMATENFAVRHHVG